MERQTEQVQRLRSAIAGARALFSSIRVRPERRLIDHTVARLLWWATADAELILLAVEHDRSDALSPVLRHLFETTHDVMHLGGVAEDPESFSAGCLVGELIDGHRQVTDRRKLTEQNPGLSGPSDGRELGTLDEWFDQITKVLDPLSHDTATLRRVYRDNSGLSRRDRGVHCTGKGRVSLIYEMLKRFASDPQETTDVAEQLVWLWRETSASGRTHSSPGWLTLEMNEYGETRRFDPEPSVPHLQTAANAAAGLLGIVTRFSGHHLESKTE